MPVILNAFDSPDMYPDLDNTFRRLPFRQSTEASLFLIS